MIQMLQLISITWGGFPRVDIFLQVLIDPLVVILYLWSYIGIEQTLHIDGKRASILIYCASNWWTAFCYILWLCRRYWNCRDPYLLCFSFAFSYILWHFWRFWLCPDLFPERPTETVFRRPTFIHSMHRPLCRVRHLQRQLPRLQNCLVSSKKLSFQMLTTSSGPGNVP